MERGVNWEDAVNQFDQVCLSVNVSSQTFAMGGPVNGVADVWSPMIATADVFLKRLGGSLVSKRRLVIAGDCTCGKD